MAQIAGRQLQDALDLALEALDGFNWAARGAWLSQQEHYTHCMPDAEAFLDAALGRNLARAYTELSDLRKRVPTLTTAASHDPRAT